ncbi:hypothetical protein M433DRAFT_152458 [Acidomyces richmondensis BFW]|nr:MAG: hypothetical protein FE78DRAFT_87633 [Acidomyces sp. 'richmondensis']KYG47277.1 hypothetical protein M433DRAFT_152458 [Acidomyces richmondensis BFW]
MLFTRATKARSVLKLVLWKPSQFSEALQHPGRNGRYNAVYLSVHGLVLAAIAVLGQQYGSPTRDSLVIIKNEILSWLSPQHSTMFNNENFCAQISKTAKIVQ